MALPPVSVIVPVGRRMGSLPDLVEAVIGLDYPLLELLLCCEKGIDLQEEVKTQASGTKRIRIIMVDASGPSGLRNAGVRASRYELLAFTDSDCTPGPEWLKELLRAKEKLRTRAVVGSSFSANYSRSRWSRVSAERYSAWLDGAKEGDYLQRLDTRNLLMEKALLTALGAFDEGLCSKEDRDLGHRLVQAGERIAFAPEARVGHRDPETIRGVYRRSVWYARGMRQFLTKHGVGWFMRSRDLVFYKRYVGESLWALVALIWYGALFAIIASGLDLRLPVPISLLGLAGLPIALLAFGSAAKSAGKFLMGRSSADDFVFDIVSDIGHKVGFISAATGIWRPRGGKKRAMRSSRRERQGSR